VNTVPPPDGAEQWRKQQTQRRIGGAVAVVGAVSMGYGYLLFISSMDGFANESVSTEGVFFFGGLLVLVVGIGLLKRGLRGLGARFVSSQETICGVCGHTNGPRDRLCEACGKSLV
jgi:uncharacterized membrane protein